MEVKPIVPVVHRSCRVYYASSCRSLLRCPITLIRQDHAPPLKTPCRDTVTLPAVLGSSGNNVNDTSICKTVRTIAVRKAKVLIPLLLPCFRNFVEFEELEKRLHSL